MNFKNSLNFKDVKKDNINHGGSLLMPNDECQDFFSLVKEPS